MGGMKEWNATGCSNIIELTFSKSLALEHSHQSSS